MTTIVVHEPNHPDRPGFTDNQIELIKRTVAKGASNDELELFLHQCKKTGLDPLAKQIYFQKRTNNKTGQSNIVVITAIDGYRLVAHRTGQYAGIDPTVFDSEENPKKATVTVYKMVGGVRCPFTASSRWDQYYPGDHQGAMWRKMPHLMLEKCAEALALRKAFPAELSGVYTHEEMEQAEQATVSLVPPPSAEEIPSTNIHPPHEPSHQAEDSSPILISEKQGNRLYAIAMNHGYTRYTFPVELHKKFGFLNSTLIPLRLYDGIVAHFERPPTRKPGHPKDWEPDTNV